MMVGECCECICGGECFEIVMFELCVVCEGVDVVEWVGGVCGFDVLCGGFV